MEEESEKLDQLKLAKLLVKSMDDDELACKYKSAVVVNDREQPMMLSSSDDFERHYLNLAGGDTLGFPTKMIPYMIQALKRMYEKNGLDHFNGDKAALDAYTAESIEDCTFNYIDLNDIDIEEAQAEICGCGDPNCGSNIKSSSNENDEMVEELNNKLEGFDSDVAKKLREITGDLIGKDAIANDLDRHSKIKLLDAMMDAKEIAREASEKIDKQHLTKEEMEQLNIETEAKILEKMEAVEAILLGKKTTTKEEVTLERIEKIMTKFGPDAAKEELMRLPVEKRDEVLKQILENIKNKGK